MAPIAPLDILRVTARMQVFGSEDLVNTFHIRVDTNTTVSDDAFMTELAASVDAAYQILNVEISTKVSYVDIDAQNITQNELLPGKPWPVLVNGAKAVTILPPRVSAFAFFRTLRPKTRCGVYLGGFTENANTTDGLILAAVATIISNFQNAVLVGFSGANFTSTYGAYNKPVNRFTPVDQAVNPTSWATQRRRKPGIGS